VSSGFNKEVLRMKPGFRPPAQIMRSLC